MSQKDTFKIGATLNARLEIPYADLDKVTVTGLKDYAVEHKGDKAIITGTRHNAFVTTGLNNVRNLIIGSGSPFAYIGVTDDQTAVTASTTRLDPTSNDNVTILSISGLAADGNAAWTGEGTFTNANANFPYYKIGYLTTATDAGTGLQDVIGGGGSSPYDQAFTIDLTGASSWTATLGIDGLLTAS